MLVKFNIKIMLKYLGIFLIALLLVTGFCAYAVSSDNPNLSSVKQSILKSIPSELSTKLAYTTEKVDASNIVYDDVALPLNAIEISSPFGPRLMASNNYRYDFHRGIDFKADKGTPVKAIADGEIYRVYMEGETGTPYPDGGTVIIVKHTYDTPIEFHGKSLNTYYSLYMHLDSINVPVIKASPYPAVKKGDIIGAVGNTGTTEFYHLHLEIRVGTYCSYEYQVNNPTKLCSQVFDAPVDPHINPFAFLPYNDTDDTKVTVMSTSPLKIKVSNPRSELDFNALKIAYDGAEKIVDINNRESFNVTSLDSKSFDGVTVTPAKFNKDSSRYEITFEFSGINNFSSIEALDIWGRGVKLVK